MNKYKLFLTNLTCNMKNPYLSIAILLFAMTTVAQPVVSIIPQPEKLDLKNSMFIINEKTTIQYTDSNLRDAADLLSTAIRNISGILLSRKSSGENSIALILMHDEGLGNEGYRLLVRPDGISITANQYSGIVYGIQSLLQTLPAIRTNAMLQVPCMEIEDHPRFAWRGMHLDVSRHFFGPDLVKEYIDLMATYKLNTFHWHLVDDQGWRIEIKKYPKLTEVGAWRVDRTSKIWASREQAKEGEVANYGGFYTQDQIKEIVAYARQRGITIVPEIEMPGHVASAIASYPRLSCNQRPQLPLTGGDYTNMSSNYCAGSDEVFTFLQDVLDEVIELFPSVYVHVGGDEVDKTPWKNCARCQARMKTEKLKNEEELQSYFIKRIEAYLVRKNKRMIGWDEILEGGLAPQATVMSWRGESGGIEAAKMNHTVVMTPGSPCYFDHYQGDPSTEPAAIGGFNTLKTVYGYEPVPRELNEQQGRYVLGAQANLWTEYVTTAEHVEYMTLPRMLALSEVVWSPRASRNWESFNQRLQQHFRKFDQKGLRYSKGNFKVDISPFIQNGSLMAGLSTEIYSGEVYYSIDGSTPTLQSKKFTEPVRIESSLTLKAITVVNGNMMSTRPAEQAFSLHQANGGTVNYTFPVSSHYQATGPNSLTDGIRGTAQPGKYWHGISGHDLVATINMMEVKNIHKVSIGCLQRYNDWIFLPQKVSIELSVDGKSYVPAGELMNTISPEEKEPVIKNFEIEIKPQKVKFIRLTARNLGVCPKGHSGEGKSAWLFADEIVVE